ncbi:MAG: sigma-54-dependent transcriptional regulator [Chitinivibrionales bacterium]
MEKDVLIGRQVWIVEDDKNLGMLLEEELTEAKLQVRWFPSAETALQAMNGELPELIVCDLRLPGMDGMNFMKTVRSSMSHSPPGFLLITAFGTIPKAVEALREGADNFLTKPLDLEHFLLCVQRILESKRLKDMVSRMRGLLRTESFHDMYGTSVPMRMLYEQIKQVAKARGPVLILGESGSGKELVARAIHKESERAEYPMLPVNCAGIPEHLLESEFFGHTQGSFTGANKGRQGLFAEAQGGTMFLDEISEMPLPLQAKLLRILQDGTFRRLGENQEQTVDVRIIAATHRDLDAQVAEKTFREDLFFRLETFTLRIPPLRERGDDLELLAVRFMQQFSLALNKNLKGFSADAMTLISNYPFPGNVRELRNAVERAVTFSTTDQIRPEDLPARIRDRHLAPSVPSSGLPACLDGPLMTLEEMERRYIKHVLDTLDGNKRRAAAVLGIGRRTLYRKFDQGTEAQQGQKG